MNPNALVSVLEDRVSKPPRAPYDATDHQTVWETVRNDLPMLKAEVHRLLAEER